MKDNPIIALAVADLHASLRPPVARSDEENWLEAQARPFRQLRELSIKHGGVPILAAGDCFDKWDSRPELIEWSLTEMPVMVAVAGNHDLPGHRLDQMHRSAYGVLVKAGRIIDVKPGKPIDFVGRGGNPFRVHGFPCGVPIQRLKDPHDLAIEIALVHDYIWTEETGHPGASDESNWRGLKKKTAGYDLVIIGDNHKPFACSFQRDRQNDVWTRLYGCGGFQRRRADEVDHRPSVGLIHADGTVKRHRLDCSQDKFLEPDQLRTLARDADEGGFVDALASMGDAALDFADAVKHAMDSAGVSDGVRKAITDAMEQG